MAVGPKSDMSENGVEWPRDAVEVDRLDKDARIAKLSTSDAPQEASQLGVEVPIPPLRLFLERAKRPEIALGFEKRLEPRGTHRAEQLVFEIVDTNVETERLHLGPSER